MKKSKVYTCGGDKGTTSLVGGKRVRKSDMRLDAYGTIDELSAHIGLLVTKLPKQDGYYHFLLQVQRCLFEIGSYLATDADSEIVVESGITLERIRQIEESIDIMDEQLPPLTRFVLPGGCEAASQAHVCRTVCRRAERFIYRLDEVTKIDSFLLQYVNRLSDWFFVFSRFLNKAMSHKEFFWEKGCF